jgi:pimeloyl-ACP methyl ester carboxylesterase
LILVGSPRWRSPRRAAVNRPGEIVIRTRNVIGLLFGLLALSGLSFAAPIDERGFVPIGGIEQWITVKGASRENPVVLFVHGGPGNSQSPFADAMFTGWEKDFTLVQWDQRGAGRTYGRTGPSIESTLTLERIVDDGIEVAQYLSKHLHKQRIVIVGGSWGSLVGIHLAKKRPDLFTAYIGTGQLVNMRENTRASYEHVLAYARETKDARATEELTQLGPPPFVGFAKWRTFRKWRNTYQARLATAPRPDSKPSAEYSTDKDLADYEAADDLSFAHFNFVGTSMTGPMMDIDLRRLGKDFKTPVYIIQGAVDMNAVPEIARDYLEWINAPAKQFILVPDTAHADSIASLAQVRRVLTMVGQ